METSSSSSRVKLTGAVVAAALLVIAGVVALNNTGQGQVVSLEHAQAIAHAETSNVPMSQLPDESAVTTPRGWVIDSDEAVAGAPEEEISETADGFVSEDLAEDDDIDSSVLVEQDDETGEKFVAELDDGVIADSEEEDDKDGAVAADGKKKLKCRKSLRKRSTKRVCKRTCTKKCRPVTRKICRRKKFCRCFCKYKGNKKAAVKCVTYKRKICRQVKRALCKRQCKKFCKMVPHSYCCPMKRIRRICRRMCRRRLIITKCGNCRCRKIKCYRACILTCK